MRFRNTAILCGITVLLAFGFGLVWLVQNYREPDYQGKTLTQWVGEYNGRADAPASQALVHIGKKAAPWLARMLNSRDTGLRTRLMTLLAKQSVVKIRLVPAGIRQDEALKVTSMLGVENTGALVPGLAALVRDYPGRVAQANAMLAENILSEMGSNGITALLETLHHRDLSVRVHAAELLGTAPGTDGPEVVAALRGCQTNSDVPLQAAATLSLDLIQHRQANPLPPGTTNWTERPLDSAPDPVSIWHVSRGVRLLATSLLAPGDNPLEFFGAHAGGGQGESLAFTSGMPDGTVHYIEWEMPSPITLRSFGLISANDGPVYSYMGAFRAFRLYARGDTNGPFALIYSEDIPVPTRVGLFNSVNFAFRNLPASVTATQFRAEFAQNGTAQYHGPRTEEFFGFSEPLNSALISRALQSLEPNTRGVAKLLYGENLLE